MADELEDILLEEEAPSRVSGGRYVPRIAKLTARTISSLKTKIKEGRMESAYRKYNKKYKKMKNALIDAEKLKKEKANGADITETELNIAYSIAASYSKKLGKLGAKLLKDDIKKVVASQPVKPIKVPRILFKTMRKLTMAVVKIRETQKTKKLHKELAKEMQKSTADYISSSVENSIYSNIEGATLNEKIDVKTIKDLGLKGGKEETERRLDTLKYFISKDGKTPVLKRSENGEETLNKNVTTANTTVPPTNPDVPEVGLSADSNGVKSNGQVVIDVNGLLEKIIKSNTNSNTDTSVNVNSSNDSEVEEENKRVSECKKEIINLKNQLGKGKDSFSDVVINTKIKLLEREIEEISQNDPEKKENKDNSSQVNKTEQPVSNQNPETKTGQKGNNQPEIVIGGQTDTPRVNFGSRPRAVRVTPDEIKKLLEQNEKVKNDIADGTRKREELLSTIEMLKKYVEAAMTLQKNEEIKKNLDTENRELTATVEGLNAQALGYSTGANPKK